MRRAHHADRLIVLIVPTLQRGNAAPDAPASASATNHQQPHPPPSRPRPAPTEKPGTCGRSGPCPRYQPRQKKKKDATSNPPGTPTPQQLKVSTAQQLIFHAPAWERADPDAPASPEMASPPCRGAFFCLPAQRKEPKERAALPLRRPRSTGCATGGARTRCAQTACPLFPVPHPADRLSAKGLFSSPETRHAPNRQPGGASVPPRDGEF